MSGHMAHYLQSQPYSVHAAILSACLGCIALVWPVCFVLVSSLKSLPMSVKKAVLLSLLSVLTLPWLVVGLVFMVLVLPAAHLGNAAVSGVQAGTVPITGLGAGALWWFCLPMIQKLKE